MTIQKRIGLVTVLIVLGGALHAQVVPVVSYTEAHRAELTAKFRDFLSIPNVAADPAGLEHNADFLLGALRERGVEARLLAVPGAPPVVYGEIRTPGAEHTIVLYAHYDGQPVTPAAHSASQDGFGQVQFSSAAAALPRRAARPSSRDSRRVGIPI